MTTQTPTFGFPVEVDSDAPGTTLREPDSLAQAIEDVLVARLGTPLYSKRTHSSTQSIPDDSLTQVSLDTLVQQNDSGFGSTDDQITIPEAGYYDIKARMTWNAGNNSGSRYVALLVDGNQMSTDKFAAFTGVGTQDRPVVVYSDYFDGGEIITMEAYQDSGGSVDTSSGTHPFIEVRQRLESS